MTTARTIAASYIVATGDALVLASGKARLLPVAKALVNWIGNEFQTKAPELADANRTQQNVISASAAILAQRNALIAALAVSTTEGPALRSSTGEVILAQRRYSEGFGGLYNTAMQAFYYGTNSPGDLAQALLPLTDMEPLRMRQLAASMPNVQSVQDELKLCEVLCAYVRRLGLAYSMMAAIQVAPSKQPDASLTRAHLLEQLDRETGLASKNPELLTAFRDVRKRIISFTAWFSQGGGGTLKVPYASAGKPLAATAADMYALGDATGMDAVLMEFNGVDHPLFGPAELDAVV